MKPSKKASLLTLLTKQWVTPLDALQKCGVMSLAQRVSEWRASGVVILDKWVCCSTGSRVKAYKIVRPTKWTA